VLNRLYIVIGMLMILVLAGAFVVPHFVDWSSRRGQMETLASEALGRPVKIGGEIDFVLLPQPRLLFSDVVVGEEAQPIARAASAEAEFSLMDFLRDRFVVTRLLVRAPQLFLSIEQDGTFAAPLHLPESIEAGNISIANAEIESGDLYLTDRRSGAQWSVNDLDGLIQLSALRGPFSFAGQGTYDGEPVRFRIATSEMNNTGRLQVAASAGPEDGSTSVSVEGLLQTALRPEFTGKATFRQKPPKGGTAETVRGDQVVEADVELRPDQFLMTDYTWLPDENRGTTRLTGAAVVELGEAPRFDAVISGGVVALAPRDAREETADQPYELVRLLSELPTPLVPPLPGKIAVDVTELNLRAIALRNVRFDALSDSESWQLDQFSARLPGDGALDLSGRISVADDQVGFNGEIGLVTDRPDALAQMWRGADDSVALFGVPTNVRSKVTLRDGRLDFSDGDLNLGDADITFEGGLDYEETRSLDFAAKTGSLSAADSEAFWAILPRVQSDDAFLTSFPSGTFDVFVEGLDSPPMEGLILGLEGVSARGSWDDAGLRFDLLSARDLGGAGFTLSGLYSGSGRKARVQGSGRITLSEIAKSGILPVIFERTGTADELRPILENFAPASFEVELTGDDVQSLVAGGRLGESTFQIDAELSEGLLAGLDGRLTVRSVVQGEPDELAAQFGLPEGLALDSGPVTLTVGIDGALANSVDADIAVSGPDNRLSYEGTLIATDLNKPTGRGRLDFDLSDSAGWVKLLGMGGIHLPPVSGVGEVSFEGHQTIQISALQAEAGDVTISGDLSRALEGLTATVSGQLALNYAQPEGLARVLFGAESLIPGSGIWPEGPFALGTGERESRGRVGVTVDVVEAAERELARDARFDLVWDAQNLRVSGGSAAVGDGRLSFDLGVCCEPAPNSLRQVTGRWRVANAPFAALVPEATGAIASAAIDGAGQFNSTGETLADMIGSLAGEASFTASGVSVAGADPSVFAALADRNDLADLDPEELGALVSQLLEQGRFETPQLSGVFSVGGGTLRARNLSLDNPDGTLFGGLALELGDLSLSGDWALSPRAGLGRSELINEATARIGMHLGGTLLVPERELDLGAMVDAIQVKALELEVDELERLRAEQEARARQAAEERARLMEEEAARRAAEAAQAEQERQAAEGATQEQSNSIEELLKDLGESQDPLLNNDGSTTAPVDLLAPAPTPGSF
jgi:hypothetical protein